jgi:hypothetical protein
MRFELLMALSFSNIVFFLNFFKISHAINTMLYLCSISALLATIGMIYLNPTFQRDRAQKHYRVALPLFAFNLGMIGWHFLPVYLFRKRQTLRQLVEPRIIAGALMMWVIYFMVMRKKNIDWLYSLSPTQWFVLCAVLLVLYASLHVLLSRV